MHFIIPKKLDASVFGMYKQSTTNNHNCGCDYQLHISSYEQLTLPFSFMQMIFRRKIINKRLCKQTYWYLEYRHVHVKVKYINQPIHS